jgi:hypothetical protein
MFALLGPGYKGHQFGIPAMLLPVNSNMMGLQFKKEKTVPNYIIAYHGGTKPESPEQGAEQMAKWETWVEGLGEAVVNPGTPLMKTRIVSSTGVSDDGGPNSVSGFSVVQADNMEAALEMAKACPFLDTGGTLEVAEMVEM